MKEFIQLFEDLMLEHALHDLVLNYKGNKSDIRIAKGQARRAIRKAEANYHKAKLTDKDAFYLALWAGEGHAVFNTKGSPFATFLRGRINSIISKVERAGLGYSGNQVLYSGNPSKENRWEEGKVFSPSWLFAASLNKNTAEYFMFSESGTMFEIRPASGKGLYLPNFGFDNTGMPGDFGEQENEEEVLYRSGTKFKVLKVVTERSSAQEGWSDDAPEWLRGTSFPKEVLNPTIIRVYLQGL